MARKHDLTDGEASDNGASSSRGKRQRTSPLPNSTPPAEPEQEQDDDASGEEDDPMSDIEQTEEEQQALEEMKATQAIKQSVQSPPFPPALLEICTNLEVYTVTKDRRSWCHSIR